MIGTEEEVFNTNHENGILWETLLVHVHVQCIIIQTTGTAHCIVRSTINTATLPCMGKCQSRLPPLTVTTHKLFTAQRGPQELVYKQGVKGCKINWGSWDKKYNVTTSFRKELSSDQALP